MHLRYPLQGSCQAEIEWEADPRGSPSRGGVVSPTSWESWKDPLLSFYLRAVSFGEGLWLSSLHHSLCLQFFFHPDLPFRFATSPFTDEYTKRIGLVLSLLKPYRPIFDRIPCSTDGLTWVQGPPSSCFLTMGPHLVPFVPREQRVWLFHSTAE